MKANRRDWGNNRLQNSRFFLKISKEIRKAERKSFTCLSSVSLSVFTLVPDLLFDCSRVLEYAKIRTVLQSRGIKVGPNKLIHDHHHFFRFKSSKLKKEDENHSLLAVVEGGD